MVLLFVFLRYHNKPVENALQTVRTAKQKTTSVVAVCALRDAYQAEQREAAYRQADEEGVCSKGEMITREIKSPDDT